MQVRKRKSRINAFSNFYYPNRDEQTYDLLTSICIKTYTCKQRGKNSVFHFLVVCLFTYDFVYSNAVEPIMHAHAVYTD